MPATRRFELTVRIGGGLTPETLLAQAFQVHVEWSRLTEIGTARQGAAIDCTYDVRLRREDAAATLIADLHRVETVQSVELSRAWERAFGSSTEGPRSTGRRVRAALRRGSLLLWNQAASHDILRN